MACYIFGDPNGEGVTGPKFFRLNHKHRVEPPQHCGNCRHHSYDTNCSWCCHPDITKHRSTDCGCNLTVGYAFKAVAYEVCDKWEARKSC